MYSECEVNTTDGPKRHGWQWVWWIYGFAFVRPRRWFFWKMVCATYPRWWFKRDYDGSWYWPNIHWHILDRTIFEFFKWMDWDGWRLFTKWEKGWPKKSILARIIHRIGQTTAGYAIGGGECYHCGSEKGCQVELSDDNRGITFIHQGGQVSETDIGTDHQFWGTTICPVCGYRSYYEDGSL